MTETIWFLLFFLRWKSICKFPTLAWNFLFAQICWALNRSQRWMISNQACSFKACIFSNKFCFIENLANLLPLLDNLSNNRAWIIIPRYPYPWRIQWAHPIAGIITTFQIIHNILINTSHAINPFIAWSAQQMTMLINLLILPLPLPPPFLLQFHP